jgi:hypothetical protein
MKQRRVHSWGSDQVLTCMRCGARVKDMLDELCFRECIEPESDRTLDPVEAEIERLNARLDEAVRKLIAHRRGKLQ